MVFELALAAHNAMTAKSLGAGSLASAHTQSLDGAGSGCGPMGNNCSGNVPLASGDHMAPHARTFRLGKPHESSTMSHSSYSHFTKSRSEDGFFGPGAQPSDHGYTMNAAREGSAQNVSYQAPSDYTDYANTGMHGGLFKFHGAPANSHTASSMIAPQADGGVHVHATKHAFGSDSSEANAMYIAPSHSHTLSFYGNHHALSWQKSITRTNAIPEQLPVGPATGGPAPGGVGGGSEATFIMGNTAHTLNSATSMINSGHATASNTAHWITSRQGGYQYSAGPSADTPYGVSFASQTLRTSNMGKTNTGVQAYKETIGKFNDSADASSAYAMDAAHAGGSRIVDKPYHPAAAAYCNLYPDKCFFSPQPETQSMGGGYHSI